MPLRHHSSAGDHTYVNGLHAPSSRKERPKTVELGSLGKTSPKPPPKFEQQIPHAGPPKFRRKNSTENLLANKSLKISPVFGKKMLQVKKREENNNDTDDDDDDYEEIREISEVKPYAIHDIAPAARVQMSTNGSRKGPERPAPPPKVVTTMKPSPPIVAPRVPRANTVSAMGLVVEQKLGKAPPTSIPRPSKAPPKVPQSPPKVPKSSPKVLQSPKVPQSSPKVPQSPIRNRMNIESTGKEVSREGKGI